MIVLIPSKRVAKDTGIDFDLVNTILNTIIPTCKNKNIRVIKAHKKAGFSAFYPDDNKIAMQYDSQSSLNYIIGTILHEVRHSIQSEKFNNLEFVYKNYQEYYNSPEEKDARNFEKLSMQFCSVYRNFVKLKEKFIKNKLNSFELLE